MNGPKIASGPRGRRKQQRRSVGTTQCCCCCRSARFTSQRIFIAFVHPSERGVDRRSGGEVRFSCDEHNDDQVRLTLCTARPFDRSIHRQSDSIVHNQGKVVHCWQLIRILRIFSSLMFIANLIVFRCCKSYVNEKCHRAVTTKYFV